MVAPRLRLSMDDAEFRAQWKALEMDVRVKSALLLETVGLEAVSYLRSLIGDTRPPARVGGSARRAHPGGWADVTGQLAASYYFAVTVGSRRLVWTEPVAPGTTNNPPKRGGIPRTLPPGRLSLVLGNLADHAVYVEAMDGYYVLTGVTEEAGPIESALRRAALEVGAEIT